MFLASCSLGYKRSYRCKDGGYGWEWAEGTNRSGKTGLEFKYCNGTGKTIKYIIFTCIPYNSVNDVVSCEVTGDVVMRFQVTGPIGYGSVWLYTQFEDGWYNPTIKSAKITKVEIQYMDGSAETLSEEQLAANMRIEEQEYQKQLPQLQLQALKDNIISCLIPAGIFVLAMFLFVMCMESC